MCDVANKIIELDPCGNDIFAFASRKALTLYAEILQEEMPQIAEELHTLVAQEEKENIKALHKALKISPETNPDVSGCANCCGLGDDADADYNWDCDDEEEEDDGDDSDGNTHNSSNDDVCEVLKIEVCDELFSDLSKMAHQYNISVNDLCSDIIMGFMQDVE